VHLVGGLVSHVLTTTVAVWIGVRLYNPQEAITWEMLRQATLLSSRLPLSVITYAGILAVDRAVTLFHALTERRLVAARLEAQATRARLEALAARLQPHFLFNALQSVGALVDEHPARARAMLAQLGDLLRDVLAAPTETELPLEDEVALLARYLAIEEIRFADRLTVQYAIDPATRAVPVPRFLLQPLAENALRHGLAPLPGHGTLRIASRRDGNAVELTVWNDGLRLSDSLREGVGLATTRERLAARYGGRATFALGPHTGGVAATIRIPA
jgi:LytS/YehU family sensor histidine kinase